MKKSIFLTILVIIISQVKITWAFLGSDLWLDLYKNLDEWLKSFEESQYVYELSGQEKQDISEKINTQLESENIKGCLISWINPVTIESIAKWNIWDLIENLEEKEECWYNEQTEKFDSLNATEIWQFISEISKITSITKDKAEKKAKAIYETSRIWMYSDWDTKNSPFDLIEDISQIDEVIFSEIVEYEWDENSFLQDSARKYIWDYIIQWPDSPTNLIDPEEDKENQPNKEDWEELEEVEIEEIPKEAYLNLDGNSYMCIEETNESWLSNDSLNLLNESLSMTWSADMSFNFAYYWWHVKLPNSNKIEIPDLNSNNYSNSYVKINDNSSWGCNRFFCITIDFVVKKQKALWWYKNKKTIEWVLNESNKHLKKWANTSLAQSKMTTNNFELNLRDINMPEMFHLWLVVMKKAPPILNLENITQKQESWENQSWNSQNVLNMLRKKYKSLWLDYNNSNDIRNFLRKDEEVLSIISSIENSSTRAEKLMNEYRESLRLESKIVEYQNYEEKKEIKNNLLKDFGEKFFELEQFTSNLLEYSQNLWKLVKKLDEDIPTYSW